MIVGNRVIILKLALSVGVIPQVLSVYFEFGPTTEAIYFWVHYSMPCVLGGVSTWAGVNTNFTWRYCFLLVISLALVFHYIRVLSTKDFREILVRISTVLSLCSSRLWYSMLWILAALAFTNSEFCLLNSGRLLGFVLIFPSGSWPGNSLQWVCWGNCRVFLTCFSSVMDDCSVLSIVQCLITIVSYIFFWCSGYLSREDKSYLWLKAKVQRYCL